MVSTPDAQRPNPKESYPERRWSSAAFVLVGSWVLGVGSPPGAQAPAAVLDNEHVRVTRNASPCAKASPACGQRIVVALGEAALTAGTYSEDKQRGVVGGVVALSRTLKRGDVAVVAPDLNYSLLWRTGDYLEVTIKPQRPPIASPPEIIPPDKNSILYDGDDFFVFEEKLDPGDTRARHSHRARVVIVINKTRLQQWPDGAPELFRDQIPDDVRFNPPVVHIVKTVGDQPLRNIVIEFKR
jgi:hypothetical protein